MAVLPQRLSRPGYASWSAYLDIRRTGSRYVLLDHLWDVLLKTWQDSKLDPCWDASPHPTRLVLRDPVAKITSLEARLSCLDLSVTAMFTKRDICLICSDRRLARLAANLFWRERQVVGFVRPVGHLFLGLPVICCQAVSSSLARPG